MKQRRFLSFILALTLMFPIMNSLLVQHVSATSENQIILPFSTSWEPLYTEAKGKETSVDYSKDFSSPYLNDVYDADEYGVALPDPKEFFGFGFGLRLLKSAGRFGSPNSYCYFNLFDMTPECDARPPFKVRPHTFISIFYYHYRHRDCMIDAQLYNKRTRQYWTLRDFNYNGRYIVDQNGVRIHPAHRLNDPIGSWQFASFDLSIIHEQDPATGT